MVKKPLIYLDTSVISFLFADDAPEKKEITIDFFENFIKTGIYSTFVSDFVIAEIEDTTDEALKIKLLNVIPEYHIEMLKMPVLKEIEALGFEYIRHKVIPENKVMDAYHIAISVLMNMDYLVSWNYKHLANVNREKGVMKVNRENNYPTDLRIITPLELMDYGSKNI